MLRIRIPATTTNLGSGFDSLGMALCLYNEIDVEKSDAFQIVVPKSDEGKIPCDETNLIVSSMEHAFKLAGMKMPTLKITQRNNIPMTRGLGSSAACIVGGILAANSLMEGKLTDDEMYELATKLDGHPDNVIPAFTGGLINAALDGDKVYLDKETPDEKYSFLFVIPNFELSTKKARKVIPDSYSKQDTVLAISRALLMRSALVAGTDKNLRIASMDTIHQPYRKKFIDNFDAIIDLAYDNGACGAYLSGAGPTIGIISTDNFNKVVFESKLPDGYLLLDLKCAKQGAVCETI